MKLMVCGAVLYNPQVTAIDGTGVISGCDKWDKWDWCDECCPKYHKNTQGEDKIMIDIGF